MSRSIPTSPAMSTPSPHTPHSPMVLDIPRSLPQLQTTFSQPLRSPLRRTPTSACPLAPWSRRSNGSSMRRNSLTSPMQSPTQVTFAPISPCMSIISAKTPERVFFHDAKMQTPMSATFLVSNGRQSRMEMRSAMPFDRVMTLPLRVNTNVASQTIDEETAMDLDETSTALSSASSSATLVNWGPAADICRRTGASSNSSNSPRRLRRTKIPSPITTTTTTQPRSSIHKSKSFRGTKTGLPRLPSPPHYHMTLLPSPCTQYKRDCYTHQLKHMKANLIPLISVSTGLPHPQFPTTILQYHLLTHDTLDSLARWYHQVTPPVEETFQYPAWIPAWTSLDRGSNAKGVNGSDGISLEIKRRRWGRFIGLQGCESPTVEEGAEKETAEEIARRMEREWRRVLERAEEESRAWEKSWRGRW
jgi:hypothetical protein